LATKQLAVASPQRNVPHFLFTKEFSTKNNITVVPHTVFLFPQLNMKLKGHRFVAIEVIEAESQAMLDTITEHDFQGAFKKWQ
jgi:hypothetical protein